MERLLRTCDLGVAFLCILTVGLPGIGLCADGGTDGSDSRVEQPPAHRLGSLIVHGTRLDDPVEDPLTPVLSQELTTSRIDREEIEMLQPRTAADALNFLPAFHKRRKGRKNEVGLTLRGTGNVNVLFDGMSVGTKEDSRFANHLSPGLLEEIRVIRDSTGLIYGPPQLTGPGGVMGYGGVIDFRLLEPGDAHHGEFRTEFGRFDETMQRLQLSGPVTETLGYVVSADRRAYGGPGGENMEDEYRDYLGRLVWRYWGDSTLCFNILHEDGERELQAAEKGSLFYGRQEECDPLETTITTLRLNHVWTDDVSTTVEMYYRDYEATYHWYKKQENDLSETKKGIALRQTVRFPECNTLRLGGETSLWSNPTGKLYYMGMDRREKNYSFYIQDELTVVPDRLTVDGGIRWDRTYLDKGIVANGPPFVAGKPVVLSDTWEDPAVSWSVGATLKVTSRDTLTARWSLSRQAADSSVLGNSESGFDDVEQSRYELGYHVDVCKQLMVTLTGFYSRIDNGLVYAGPSKPVDGVQYPTWTNADYEDLGIELQAEGEVAHGVGYFVNGMWINTTVRRPGEGQDHNDKVPRFVLGGGLRFRHGAWRASVSAKYTSEFQGDFGTQPAGTEWDLGDYWLLDANVSYTFHTGERLAHEVYCGVRNGLNEHYSTYPGWDDAGREMYAGYALKW